MPLIVDHERVKEKILDAFELCVQERMLFDISLRHVAAKAGMSHQKLLHYFPSKESLVVGYCEYTKQYMVTHCKDWFDSHNPKDYSSTLAYMNDFMCYVSSGESGAASRFRAVFLSAASGPAPVCRGAAVLFLS